jgi:mannosylglycerate hydrolase
MPDLFLARPESLIRNLQRGIEMSDALGGASRMGYVPDSFGHFAQLPQILNGMGISQFLFMRGMPESLRDGTGALFQWRAPNGSSVLAVFLREGYFPLGALGQESFHGRYDGLSADFSAAEQRLNQTLERLQPVQKHSVFVLPAGGDHLPARSDLAEVVSHLNKSQSAAKLEFGSFESFFERLTESANCSTPDALMQNLTAYEGDLLGQADHPLLRNVLSARVDLKQLNHKAQALLIGLVEPLLAWSRIHQLESVDSALLQCGWDALMKNHAHDDICGCSVDEVHLDDVQRFHEIFALGEEIITRQLERATATLWGEWPQRRSSKVVVFNPHPWPVEQRVRARVLLPDEGGEFSEPSKARRLSLKNAAGEELELFDVESHCKDIRSRYLETTWGRSYQFSFKASVPALSVQLYAVSETEQELSLFGARSRETCTPPKELIEALEIQWEADVGDGYSFAPVPELGIRTAELELVEQSDDSENEFIFNYILEAPADINKVLAARGEWTACQGPLQKMKIEVRARSADCSGAAQADRKFGESAWALTVSYTNVLSDCRIRLLSVLPDKPLRLVADAQARWEDHATEPVPQELWPGPQAVPRYPGEKPYTVHHVNDGIVSVLPTELRTFAGAGLHEFEYVMLPDGRSAKALTLQRSVASLSVRGGRIRSCQAGPQRPTPDAQLLKPLSFRVVWGVLNSQEVARAFRQMKELLEPVWVQEAPVVPVLKKNLGANLSESIVDIHSLPLQLMALKPCQSPDEIVVRLLNPTGGEVSGTVTVHGRCVAATQINGGKLDVVFAPYEIKTWKISLC